MAKYFIGNLYLRSYNRKTEGLIGFLKPYQHCLLMETTTPQALFETIKMHVADINQMYPRSKTLDCRITPTVSPDNFLIVVGDGTGNAVASLPLIYVECEITEA